MIGALESLIKALDAMLTYISNEVSALAIALAFIFVIIRCTNSLFRDGYERFVVFSKDQLVKFLIIAALCLPIGIGPLQGSFISSFPKLIIKGGFVTADSAIKQLPSAVVNTGGSLVDLPKGLSGKVHNIRANQAKAAAIEKELANKDKSLKNGTTAPHPILESGLWAKYFLFKVLIYLIILLVLVVAVLFSGPFAFALIFLISLMIDQLAIAYVYGETKGAMDVFTNVLVRHLHDFILQVGDFIFISVLTFTFYGVLIGALLKSVIYIVTFPISVLTMPFESQRAHFISNIMKGFHIALIPLVAGIVFAISAAGYLELTKPGGVFNTMLVNYVSVASNPTLGEIFSGFIRFLVSTLIAPFALAVPIARLMIVAPRAAAELLGNGLSYSTGISERMSTKGAFGFSR